MIQLIGRSFFCLLLSVIIPEWTLSTGTNTYLTDNGFPINFLENIVSSPIVQKKLKSRWKWEVWDVVPGTHAYQVYIFNITNPQEVENGAKPNLQQVGPYYYKESRFKFDVSINLDLTVNFERNYTYTFDSAKSKGTENDLVNVLNVPLIIFSTIAAGFDPVAANSAINDLTSTGGESLVKRGVKVSDFLYHGIDVSNYKKYIQLLGPRNDLVDEFATGAFGVLKLKNGHHEKPFVVDSGLTNQNNVGRIVQWNSQKKLSWWSGDRCNMINGSDSSVFPPYINPNKILQIFDLDICRSVTFKYSNEMMFKGVVSGMQFNIAKDVLEDPKIYSPNMCFCKTPDSCLLQGVIDISNCRNGAPFVMSYPHFLDANPEYLQAVSGLSPNQILHQTQIDVEPITGAVINYRKRFQWNMLLKPLSKIDYFQKIKPIIFPLIWNDDAFHLNSDKSQLLVEELANQMGGISGIGEMSFQMNAASSSSSILSNWHLQLILFSCFVAKICNMPNQF